MAAAQAMVPDGQQAVGVGREVDPHYGGLLVGHMVDEARILVGKPVMRLLPDVRGEQVVERRYLFPPGQFGADFQPFGVLVEHRIHDMDERLVAIEQPVPAGEQVALQPALALMFAEYLHYPPVGHQEFIGLFCPCRPLPAGNLKKRIQAVGKSFIGAEDPEISLLLIEGRHIAQELSQRMRVRRLDRARRRHRHRVLAEIGHGQVAQQ